MVGEREGILHKREAGKTDSGDVTCTYSRRKGEKRAKFENENDVDTADIEINEIYEHQQLVDKFVQVTKILIGISVLSFYKMALFVLDFCPFGLEARNRHRHLADKFI